MTRTFASGRFCFPFIQKGGVEVRISRRESVNGRNLQVPVAKRASGRTLCGRLSAVLILAFLLSCVAGHLPAQASQKEPVATVVAIDGTLKVKRGGQSNWFDGYLKMSDFIRDHLKTDEKSMAAIEFVIGGKIGINKDSEILILGDRKVEEVKGSVRIGVKKGTIWGKFEKQQKEFQIRTQSGVIGIRGTEVVVESRDDRDTTLYVLEGNVAYTAGGKTETAPAGAKVEIPYQKVPVVHLYKPEEVRKECERKYPSLNNWFVRSVLSHALSYVPYGDVALDIVDDPNHVAENLLSRAATEAIPGEAGSILGGIIRSSKKPKKPKIEFPYGLKPDRTQAGPQGVTFCWQAYEKAKDYWLMLSPDETMRTLTWASRAASTSLAYPASAEPLKPGTKYYWRLIALDKKGAPMGKASQTYFTTSGEPPPPPAESEDILEDPDEKLFEDLPTGPEAKGPSVP
jgi:hypothetical protein